MVLTPEQCSVIAVTIPVLLVAYSFQYVGMTKRFQHIHRNRRLKGMDRRFPWLFARRRTMWLSFPYSMAFTAFGLATYGVAGGLRIVSATILGAQMLYVALTLLKISTLGLAEELNARHGVDPEKEPGPEGRAEKEDHGVDS